MAGSTFPSRHEHLPIVGSTNDLVRDWLRRGTPEVCVAVADEQTSGRGREGRTWIAPRGAALLASLGFCPSYLEPEHVWQLAASVSLAMADAAEAVAGLAEGAIRLKWPNDLVVEIGADAADPKATDVAKLAGVLGETEGLGTRDPRAVVGIGVNVNWSAADFPPGLAATMTSLRELSGGRPVDRVPLLSGFLAHLETLVDALRAGRFDADGWINRQVTTGRVIELEGPGGIDSRLALGVDPTTGALIVDDPAAPLGVRRVQSGEVRHVRLTVTPTGRPGDARPARVGV